MRPEPLARAIAAAGGVNALARAIHISPAAVATWRRVPEGRLAAVSRITGIPAAELRPDLAAAILGTTHAR